MPLFVFILQLERPVPIKFHYIEKISFMSCREDDDRGLEQCNDESIVAGMSFLGCSFRTSKI